VGPNLIDIFYLCVIIRMHNYVISCRKLVSNLENRRTIKKLNTAIYLFLSFCYMELIARIFTCSDFFGIGLLFIPLFAILPTTVVSAVCSLVSKKIAKIITASVIGAFVVIYATQAIYYGFFGAYFIFYSLKAGGVAQVTGSAMINSTFQALLRGVPALLLLLVPFVFYLFFGNKKMVYKRLNWKFSALTAAAGVCTHIVLVIVISLLPGLSEIQSGDFDINGAIRSFGIIRAEVLDFKYNVLGIKQQVKLDIEVPSDVLGPQQPSGEVSNTVDTSPNVMNFDFAALNANEKDKNLIQLNNYFAAQTPTNKNEYTGMYEGYNLIYITAEGFSPYCISEELTPTLYKMSTEGFKFTNFYTPIWGVSTSDGEYTVCTGLLPKSGVWSFYRSGSNYMPFTLGNMFQSIGYDKPYAYHNHTHDYYRRDVSHPNMGYNYLGMGTGVEEYVTKRWPESDLELITGSVKDYITADKPFHAYYMTVSGHLQYSFSGNSMSSKNKDLVKHLDCSEAIKAYIACNIELDRAMEKLLAELNAAGVADKTVIMIAPDHYPYGLEQETDKYGIWRELLGHDVDTTFELYDSQLILYCQGTENAPTIDKYCSSIDILPTVLNLFGFEYDSRLLTGRDILSTSGSLVQFLDRSFITDKGKYDAKAKTFTPFEGVTFASKEEEKEYVDSVKKIVSNNFKISSMILENDYYGYLFGK